MLSRPTSLVRVGPQVVWWSVPTTNRFHQLLSPGPYAVGRWRPQMTADLSRPGSQRPLDMVPMRAFSPTHGAIPQGPSGDLLATHTARCEIGIQLRCIRGMTHNPRGAIARSHMEGIRQTGRQGDPGEARRWGEQQTILCYGLTSTMLDPYFAPGTAPRNRGMTIGPSNWSAFSGP